MTNQLQFWQNIENIEHLDSPSLLIFKDRVQANIQTVIQMAGDVSRLRPHVKTNKSVEACQMMLKAGIRKFKCATIAEAEMLAIAGAKDVLLAYQPSGPKLLRFIELIKKYSHTQFACLTDNLATAQAQSEAFLANHLKIPVYIDLNLGMHRSGILAEDGALELYQFCTQLSGFQSIGLHAYDGHIRNPDIQVRTQDCNEAFKAVENLVVKIQQLGFPKPSIVAGGSPTFPIHCQRPEVECSPGTFIYWDKGYSDICPEQNFQPAAWVMSRVISLPTKNRVCTDLGHKSIASENDISKRVFFWEAEHLKPVSQSEEHLVLEASESHSYQVGDILLGLPYHVCPTVALYERAYIVENEQVIGEWKNISRDRKLTV
jgi:D-serine deaminase-like pyridoxal phosphate-dependent protein